MQVTHSSEHVLLNGMPVTIITHKVTATVKSKYLKTPSRVWRLEEPELPYYLKATGNLLAPFDVAGTKTVADVAYEWEALGVAL